MPDLPLADVSVLDFSQAAAGPYGGELLASHGADVVMVEPPGGGSQRTYVGGAFFPNVGRNKRSVVLDLKADYISDIYRDLIRETDVVIHNYRPSTADRLGLDYDTLRSYNEELVYCSLTGYGGEGAYAERPAYDPHAQAMSGLMSNTGERDRKPARVGASVIDWGTGMFLAYAVMVALWNRERTGRGDKIEVSLLDTAAAFMGYWYTYFSKHGETPPRMGHEYAPYAPYGVVETGGGPIYIAAPLQRQWANLCEEFDTEEWLTDPRFATPDARLSNRDAVFRALERLFEPYSRSEVVERLIDAQVPAAEVQSIPEAATDTHLRERGTVFTMEDADGDDIIVADAPITFESEASRTDHYLADLGEHTSEVLDSIGVPEELQRTVESTAADD